MKRPRFSKLQIITHIGAWIPLIVLVYDFFTDNLTINPIQAATQRTGNLALILLTLSLACTPLNLLFKVPQVLKLRRPLGLYAYMYAAVHLLIFFVVDYGFNWGLIAETILEKRFILVGLTSFLLLTVLALTSFRWWMVRLGKNWKRLHRLVYLVNLLVVLHFAWAMKGDIFRLQGELLRPLLAGIIILFLLALRLPAVRQRLSGRSRRAPAAGKQPPLKPRPKPGDLQRE